MVFSVKQVVAASLLLLATTANAHMVMKSPVPYGKSTLTNSPLAADGSDFPCKQRPGVYDAEGAQNVAVIGEPQTLSFTGSAVHGGGSCQVALTTDLQPTKDSKWMVIKSIEGGCPANVPGNLPADPNGNGASVFQYTIPDGIAPGEYTIAWSWLNKIGNREYYMNCGPMTVQSSTQKRDTGASEVDSPAKRDESAGEQVSKRQTSFPGLFVANLASINSCKTTEGSDYKYPNPGAEVQQAGVGPYVDLPSGCEVGGGGSPSPAASSAPSQASQPGVQQPSAQPSFTPSSGPSGSGPMPSSPAESAPASGFPGGGFPVPTTFVTQTSRPVGPGVFVTSAAASAPAASPAAEAPTGPASPPQPSTSGSGTTAATQSGACSAEGEYACSADGTMFQRCASGEWSVPIEMAAGMKCTPGMSSDLGMSVAGRLMMRFKRTTV